MEPSRTATTAQKPVWDFGKFAFVMVAFFFYAVVDAVIAFLWQVQWAIVIAIIQILIFLAIEVFLYHLYLKGNRSFIVSTNILIGLMGLGCLGNLLEAGVLIGQSGLGLVTSKIAEAIFLILAGLVGIIAILIHFVVQEKSGRSKQYKTIDLEQIPEEEDEPPALVPPSQDGIGSEDQPPADLSNS
jgi:hypothetical protein